MIHGTAIAVTNKMISKRFRAVFPFAPASPALLAIIDIADVSNFGHRSEPDEAGKPDKGCTGPEAERETFRTLCPRARAICGRHHRCRSPWIAQG